MLDVIGGLAFLKAHGMTHGYVHSSLPGGTGQPRRLTPPPSSLALVVGCRDVALENVMLDSRTGACRLIDLGMAVDVHGSHLVVCVLDPLLEGGSGGHR